MHSLYIITKKRRDKIKIKIMEHKGIQSHQWGFFRVSDNQLIATCIAKTYYEAISYFEDEGLMIDAL
jgi:hypothetical protein